MLLAVDAGNTNVTFAVFDGDALRSEWRSTTNASRTADEYAVWLVQLMALADLAPDDIDEAIIATVVPQALFDLRTLCRRYFKCDPLVIGDDGVDLGIQNLARRPREVGADRLVNCVGAIAEFEGPLIVIDFGTATTFDIADRHGNYVGGIIAPGVNLNLEALHMASAKLPRIAVSVPDQVIGKDTVSAMQSGVYWGYISLVEGLVSRVQAEYGETMFVVGTGGLAPLFQGGTDVIQAVDQDITLRGLFRINRHNRAIAADG